MTLWDDGTHSACLEKALLQKQSEMCRCTILPECDYTLLAVGLKAIHSESASGMRVEVQQLLLCCRDESAR